MPKVNSAMSERNPLQGAPTVVNEVGILIMLPSSTEGNPILLSVKVAYWAARSFNFTVKLPIKTSGSGIIAKRKNTGNVVLFTTSFPKKYKIKP